MQVRFIDAACGTATCRNLAVAIDRAPFTESGCLWKCERCGWPLVARSIAAAVAAHEMRRDRLAEYWAIRCVRELNPTR